MISACFIVKNEEKWLEGCLTNIGPIVSEIVIVDTGSTDRTKEIAQTFGAKIFDFKWNEDFSAARNFSLTHATQPWILNFDPDERVSPADAEKIKELTSHEDADAFSFKIRNYTADANQSFFKPCQGEYPEFESNYIGYFDTQRIKLFRNGKGITFVGKVHELVESTVQGKTVTVTLPIHHFGELTSERERKSKHSNYFPILMKKAAENPANWKAQYELGCEYISIQNFQEAMKYLERASILSDYPPIFSHLGHCYFMCGKITEAEKTYKTGLVLFPTDHDIRFNYAIMKVEEQKWADAVKILEPLQLTSPDSFAALRALGYCQMNLERFAEARVSLEKALQLFPAFEDAKVDLAILRYLEGNQGAAVQEAKQILEFFPNSPRAQGLLKAIEARS